MSQLRPWARRHDDQGSAVVEFVFAAVLMMVPIVYLIVTVATVQREQLAVTVAARDAGRAFATSDTVAQGLARAQVAANIAFADARYSDAPIVRFVAADATSCAAPAIEPTLKAGSDFAVCVARSSTPPGIPSVTHFKAITVQGEFRVHVDDFGAGA